MFHIAPVSPLPHCPGPLSTIIPTYSIVHDATQGQPPPPFLPAAAAAAPLPLLTFFSFLSSSLCIRLFLESARPPTASPAHSTVCPSVLSLLHDRVDSGEANHVLSVFLIAVFFPFRLVFVSTKYFNYFGIKIRESRLTRK